MKTSRVVRKVRGIAVVSLVFALLTGVFAAGVAGASPAGTPAGDTLAVGQGRPARQPAMTEEEKAKLESLKELVKQAGDKLAAAKDKAAGGDAAGAVADVTGYFGIIEAIAPQVSLPAPRWYHAISNALRQQAGDLLDIYRTLSEQGKDEFKSIVLAERDKARDDRTLVLVLGGLAKVIRNQDNSGIIARLEKQLPEAKQAAERIQNHISRLAKSELELSEKIQNMKDGDLKAFAQKRLHLVRMEMEAAAKALEAAQYKVSLLTQMLEYAKKR